VALFTSFREPRPGGRPARGPTPETAPASRYVQVIGGAFRFTGCTAFWWNKERNRFGPEFTPATIEKNWF
jgi:hypothetical protein